MQQSDDLYPDDLVVGGNPYHQVSILMVTNARIGTADLRERLPSEEHDAELWITGPMELVWDEARWQGGHWEAHGENRFEVFRSALRDAIGKGRIRIGFQCRELLLHIARQPDVVIVEERDIGGLGQCKTCVATATCVVLSYPLVCHAESPRQRFGLVVRIVVNDDDLSGTRDQRRLQDAFDSGTEQPRPFVRRNDHGDGLVEDGTVIGGRHR
jgi:hypothetical protein